MHTIQVDDMEVSGIALKTALLLKDMDTRLTSILIDISGSTATPAIHQIIRTTLFGIADALEISVSPMALVSLVQFDDGIRRAHTMPVKTLTAFLSDYEIYRGGGSEFGQLVDVVNGARGSPIDFTRRIGMYSNTPVMFISDGGMPEMHRTADFMEKPFGTKDTFFMKYGDLG